MVQSLKHFVQLVEIGAPRIDLLTDTRVDGDIFERIVVEYRHNPIYLIRRQIAQSHLDRQPRLQPRDNKIQQSPHLVRVRQDARAAVFGSHTSHRAAHIPIDLIITQLKKAVGKVDKLVGFVPKQLRHNRYAAVIQRREHILNLLVRYLEVAVRERQKRAYSIVKGTGIAPVVNPAEKQFGQALHWSENEHEGVKVKV